ncbi:MAG TPA: phage tail protein [Anaerolineae bacterium]|nr:phage tail protein [Anaerolineae bacterium]
MPAMRGVSDRSDPLVGFHFGIEIQGVITGYFTECTGIGSENEVIDHKVVDTTGKEYIHKIPGRLKWENVTLKRGITQDLQLWEWRDMIVAGNVESARKNGSIVMFDQQFSEVARWNFENAWPLKVSGPTPKSDSNEYGVEEIVITHEGIYRET